MPPIPAPFALLQMITGSMVTQAVYAAAELEIADVLNEGPMTATQVAERVHAHPETTYRLMRLLASYGLFTEGDDGRFDLAPIGDALRADAPLSMRPIALLIGDPTHWEDWSHFTDAVRTGEPAVDKLRGMSTWEYVMANPEYGAVFFAGMGALSTLETEPVLAAYDFSRFDRIVDVGGGLGVLLSAVLGKAQNATGVLSAPPSVEAGQEALERAGIADRCTVDGRQIFEAVPADGDAYLVKHVLHDWPEQQVRKVLENIRAAISPTGKLLVMEFVLPEGDQPHTGKLIDLWLHLLVGGRERTEAQYRELFASTGFRLTRIIPTEIPLSIIEGEPI
jgi:hypothetical protein